VNALRFNRSLGRSPGALALAYLLTSACAGAPRASEHDAVEPVPVEHQATAPLEPDAETATATRTRACCEVVPPRYSRGEVERFGELREVVSRRVPQLRCPQRESAPCFNLKLPAHEPRPLLVCGRDVFTVDLGGGQSCVEPWFQLSAESDREHPNVGIEALDVRRDGSLVLSGFLRGHTLDGVRAAVSRKSAFVAAYGRRGRRAWVTIAGGQGEDDWLGADSNDSGTVLVMRVSGTAKLGARPRPPTEQPSAAGASRRPLRHVRNPARWRAVGLGPLTSGGSNTRDSHRFRSLPRSMTSAERTFILGTQVAR
jgi:hypothetical protein